MRLTLIRPNLGDFRSLDAMPPLAMGILAARAPDCDIQFYDEKAEALPTDDEPDLVALSIETYTARRAYAVADAYRARGVPVVVGGYHPTFLPMKRWSMQMRWSSVGANSFAKFPIGSMKHVVMCTHDGLIAILQRNGEREVRLFAAGLPWAEYQASQTKLRVKANRYEGYLHQVAGPNSLATLERAAGESLRDVAFLRARPATIDGKAVQIGRVPVKSTRPSSCRRCPPGMADSSRTPTTFSRMAARSVTRPEPSTAVPQVVLGQ